MIHNIVIVENKEYQAVSNLDCENCAFCNNSAMCEHMACAASERKDRTIAIFKPHYKPTTSELTNYTAAIRFDAVGGE